MIDKKTVEYIASLARLEISEDEKTSMTQEMGAILGYIDLLNEADTDNVAATSFVDTAHDPLRADVLKPSLSSIEALSNGPSVKKGHFAVPKVIG